MNETKRHNTRGMSINQILVLVEQAIDELVDENEELFRISMMDGGVPIEAADAAVESRRAEKNAWRKATLSEMRRLLERDGAHLNS